MKKRVLIVFALLAIVGASAVFAQMSRSERAARIPSAQQLRDMVNQPKLNNMVLLTGGGASHRVWIGMMRAVLRITDRAG